MKFPIKQFAVILAAFVLLPCVSPCFMPVRAASVAEMLVERVIGIIGEYDPTDIGVVAFIEDIQGYSLGDGALQLILDASKELLNSIVPDKDIPPPAEIVFIIGSLLPDVGVPDLPVDAVAEIVAALEDSTGGALQAANEAKAKVEDAIANPPYVDSAVAAARALANTLVAAVEDVGDAVPSPDGLAATVNALYNSVMDLAGPYEETVLNAAASLVALALSLAGQVDPEVFLQMVDDALTLAKEKAMDAKATADGTIVAFMVALENLLSNVPSVADVQALVADVAQIIFGYVQTAQDAAAALVLYITALLGEVPDLPSKQEIENMIAGLLQRIPPVPEPPSYHDLYQEVYDVVQDAILGIIPHVPSQEEIVAAISAMLTVILTLADEVITGLDLPGLSEIVWQIDQARRQAEDMLAGAEEAVQEKYSQVMAVFGGLYEQVYDYYEWATGGGPQAAVFAAAAVLLVAVNVLYDDVMNIIVPFIPNLPTLADVIEIINGIIDEIPTPEELQEIVWDYLKIIPPFETGPDALIEFIERNYNETVAQLYALLVYLTALAEQVRQEGEAAVNDALADAQRLVPSLLGLVLDSDGDGESAAVEIQAGSNPSNSSSSPATDDDGDGYCNSQEGLVLFSGAYGVVLPHNHYPSPSGTTTLNVDGFNLAAMGDTDGDTDNEIYVWRPIAPYGYAYAGSVPSSVSYTAHDVPYTMTIENKDGDAFSYCTVRTHDITVPSGVFSDERAGSSFGDPNDNDAMNPIKPYTAQDVPYELVQQDADGDKIPVVYAKTHDVNYPLLGSPTFSDEKQTRIGGDPDDADPGNPNRGANFNTTVPVIFTNSGETRDADGDGIIQCELLQGDFTVYADGRYSNIENSRHFAYFGDPDDNNQNNPIPYDTLGKLSPISDADGDGQANYEEVCVGTSPFDGSDYGKQNHDWEFANGEKEWSIDIFTGFPAGDTPTEPFWYLARGVFLGSIIPSPSNYQNIVYPSDTDGDGTPDIIWYADATTQTRKGISLPNIDVFPYHTGVWLPGFPTPNIGFEDNDGDGFLKISLYCSELVIDDTQGYYHFEGTRMESAGDPDDADYNSPMPYDSLFSTISPVIADIGVRLDAAEEFATNTISGLYERFGEAADYITAAEHAAEEQALDAAYAAMYIVNETISQFPVLPELVADPADYAMRYYAQAWDAANDTAAYLYDYVMTGANESLASAQESLNWSMKYLDDAIRFSISRIDELGFYWLAQILTDVYDMTGGASAFFEEVMQMVEDSPSALRGYVLDVADVVYAFDGDLSDFYRGGLRSTQHRVIFSVSSAENLVNKTLSPLEGAYIKIYKYSDRETIVAQAYTDAEGGAEFYLSPLTKYTYSVTKDSCINATGDIESKGAGQTTEIKIALERDFAIKSVWDTMYDPAVYVSLGIGVAVLFLVLLVLLGRRRK